MTHRLVCEDLAALQIDGDCFNGGDFVEERIQDLPTAAAKAAQGSSAWNTSTKPLSRRHPQRQARGQINRRTHKDIDTYTHIHTDTDIHTKTQTHMHIHIEPGFFPAFCCFCAA